MAASGKKKKASAPSDFKHIKAKVGRRAPKPANVTETSFKAASLAVRAQSIQAPHHQNEQQQQLASLELFSSRGKSLHQLMAQLQHPASAVRISAVRGLADIVKISDSVFLEAHLSTLISSVAKIMVDEDDDIRPLGLGVLKDLLQSCRQNVVRPFVPLVTAYITSALHSLDRATRLDGARAVEIVSTAVPSLMQASKILPAYVGLLSDHYLMRVRQSTSADSKDRKKRRKRNDGKDSSRYSILQSLSSLLQTISEQNTKAPKSNESLLEEPDLVFDARGRSQNGIFVVDSSSKHTVQPADLSMVAAIYHGETALSARSAFGSPRAATLDGTVACELLSKLRDTLVEVMQRGHSEGSQGLVLSTTDAEELALLVDCIQGVWSRNESQSQDVQKVVSNLLSLLLESFPVQTKTPSEDNAGRYETLNARICVILMDMGSSSFIKSESVGWIDTILNHALPRLVDDEAPNDSATSLPDSSNGTSGTIMDVVSRLMLLQNQPNEFTLSLKRRMSILKKVRDAYFLFETLDDSRVRASSTAGRKAARMLHDLLLCDSYEIFLEDQQPSLAPILRQMIKCLPLYLQAWENAHPVDSAMAISTLLNVVRRQSAESVASHELTRQLRESLAPLFAASKTAKKQKHDIESSSIFEMYHLETQRALIGLVAMLQSPSTETINGLSATCARPSTSQVLVDYILHAIHSIRKTMSMKEYLGFIMNGIVLDHGSGDREGNCEPLRDANASIQSALETLIGCGSQRVMPMISPVLEQWLADWQDDGASGLGSKQCARLRAALCLSVGLIRDIQKGFINNDSPVPSSLDIAPSITAKLISLTCTLLESTKSSREDNVESAATSELLRPMIVLMRYDEELALGVIAAAKQRICEESEDTRGSLQLLASLQHVVHDEQLRSTIMRQCVSALLDVCVAIEDSVTDEPILRQVKELRASLSLLGNVNTSTKST